MSLNYIFRVMVVFSLFALGLMSCSNQDVEVSDFTIEKDATLTEVGMRLETALNQNKEVAERWRVEVVANEKYSAPRRFGINSGTMEQIGMTLHDFGISMIVEASEKRVILKIK